MNPGKRDVLLFDSCSLSCDEVFYFSQVRWRKVMAFFGKYHFANPHLLAGGSAEVLEELFQGAAGAWKPAADILECEDGVRVLLELPGIDSEDLVVFVSGQTLTVRGIRREASSQGKRCYRLLEIHHGPFERVLSLPLPVAARRAVGHFRDGMLEIFLPRAKRPSASTLPIRITWNLPPTLEEAVEGEENESESDA